MYYTTHIFISNYHSRLFKIFDLKSTIPNETVKIDQNVISKQPQRVSSVSWGSLLVRDENHLGYIIHTQACSALLRAKKNWNPPNTDRQKKKWGRMRAINPDTSFGIFFPCMNARNWNSSTRVAVQLVTGLTSSQPLFHIS